MEVQQWTKRPACFFLTCKPRLLKTIFLHHSFSLLFWMCGFKFTRTWVLPLYLCSIYKTMAAPGIRTAGLSCLLRAAAPPHLLITALRLLTLECTVVHVLGSEGGEEVYTTHEESAEVTKKNLEWHFSPSRFHTLPSGLSLQFLLMPAQPLRISLWCLVALEPREIVTPTMIRTGRALPV